MPEQTHTIGDVTSSNLLPRIPSPLAHSSSSALQWPALREHIAGHTFSPLGRAWLLALEPSADLGWIEDQQKRTDEMRLFLTRGGSFDFHGLMDPTALLEKARIDGSALEALEIRDLLEVVERVAAWRNLLHDSPSESQRSWPGIAALSAPLLQYDLSGLLRLLRGKIEADGSLSDDASPELRRLRRAMERQHRAIEESLRKALRSFSEGGSTQDELITVRGERFVIPVKAEFKRRVPGVIHGSSSSGQTVFVEPLETIEQNNELVRLLDEEQSEIHRILVAMTRALAAEATPIHLGTCILAEVEAHWARARFALDLDCVRPSFDTPDARSIPSGIAGVLDEPAKQGLSLKGARHPLLELRMRRDHRARQTEAGDDLTPASGPTPLTLALEPEARQLIISGPNTGGKTVALKTTGLLALMAQAGVPVPASEAVFPLFTGIYADIGDAQSIESNLSSFSAHIVNVNRIAAEATGDSLVLLDELGSATDPEEGAALAVAIAGHFLRVHAWCCITTHLTSLKVYAANHAGVLNAAVGFNQETLTPTYELRLGVPGASAGLNIASRLGLAPEILAEARAQMTTQTADIGAFLDQLHEQLAAAGTEREALRRKEQEVARERSRLETEGRAEQKQRTRELEKKLNTLIDDFTYQLKETVKAIDDKKVAQKIARDSDLRMSRLRREFSEQFNSTVVAHTTGADRNDPAAMPHQPKGIKVGDLVKLKSLGRQARVDRLVDGKVFEVSIGPMKMRASIEDIGEVEHIKVVTPLEAARRRGGVTVSTVSGDADYMPSEINVIGRTADEAQQEVERFVDRAFLAGLPRIRIVHGTGMGILRRTLREFLKGHPHVTTVTEPPQNQGGQGATEVELRQ
ncbi:endonuclease MutS2 [Granulicella sibirica]|uniref:Endonuclease MutS2 n=1 Tax=Granulicella sibirica TaxID=2479048 RepID=A0A4Q0T8L7_9BACT|nr:Smr/MutS family protein [Granulicella sibirica]RXH58508.1 Recombination inhibitory protein MutS2 [Granulicella sibirica]